MTFVPSRGRNRSDDSAVSDLPNMKELLKKLKPGKLYIHPKYFLFVFENRAHVGTRTFPMSTDNGDTYHDAEEEANYWSMYWGESVTYVPPGNAILLLSRDDTCAEVLVGEKRGWVSLHKLVVYSDINRARGW